jgi:hypothetical protein
MVDYSRWDHFDVSDEDEDENEDEDSGSSGPKVMKLDEGARVTIGPEGSSVTLAQSPQKVSSSSSNKEASISPINGWSCDLYSWSQDRYEVRVQSGVIPLAAKANEFSLIVTETSLRLFYKGSVLFGGDLKYSVTIDDEDPSVDWEIINGERGRVVAFTLIKKSPIPGSLIWWNRLFIGDPEIDTSKIPGRVGTIGTSDAWEQAHEMFRQRIAASMKDAADCSDDEDGNSTKLEE